MFQMFLGTSGTEKVRAVDSVSWQDVTMSYSDPADTQPD